MVFGHPPSIPYSIVGLIFIGQPIFMPNRLDSLVDNPFEMLIEAGHDDLASSFCVFGGIANTVTRKIVTTDL